MNHRLGMTLALGSLSLGGCFDPDPIFSDSDPGTSTTEAGSTGGPGDATADGSDGAETTTGTGCPEGCSALDDDCNVGVCDGIACVAEPREDGTTCDDGLFCTEGDTCQAGACTGSAMECPGAGGCTIGVCDEDADACDVESVGEGDACDDADPCTGDGTCTAGSCDPGPDLCVELDGECSLGVCDPGVGCVPMPTNEALPCNEDDVCAQSSCQAGSCVFVAPINEGLGCEDGDFCTYGDVCQAGSCTPGTAAACPEDDVCGGWTCDEAMDTCVLSPMNEGMPCDDGNLCTPPAATVCAMGECLQPAGGGPLRTYLWEDFADNSAGWALGPEWGIGPAMVSVGGTPGADPDVDHTSTADDGVAGVVIGGLASTNLHPYYYLTSPPMAVSPGDPAILGFRRWLNSDYDPFMHNSVEVWDGAGWVQLWVSGPPPEINDTTWTYIEHDLTPYGNEAMRVRFGFDVAQDGVYTAPSWNVDDVLISSITCP